MPGLEALENNVEASRRTRLNIGIEDPSAPASPIAAGIRWREGA